MEEDLEYGFLLTDLVRACAAGPQPSVPGRHCSNPGSSLSKASSCALALSLPHNSQRGEQQEGHRPFQQIYICVQNTCHRSFFYSCSRSAFLLVFFRSLC